MIGKLRIEDIMDILLKLFLPDAESIVGFKKGPAVCLPLPDIFCGIQFPEVCHEIVDVQRIADDGAGDDADQNAIEQRMTQVEQSASEFKVEVTQAIATQVASVSNDVEAISQGLSNFQETVSGYMAFNGDSLSIGVNGSNFKTEITNTEMAFTESGDRVAYISNSDMYITRARVTDTLSVGTIDNGYFDFVTMPGGLALKWRSGSAG